MEKIYVIDWANRKDVWYTTNGRTAKYEESMGKFTKKLKKEDIVVIETGCPKSYLFSILSKGAKIYQIDSQTFAQYRGPKLSDKEEALLLYKFYKSGAKIKKIEIDKDKDFQDIRELRIRQKLTKLGTMIKNFMSSMKREFGEDILSTEFDRIKEISKMFDSSRGKIINRIARNFKSELKKVAHINGLGDITMCNILLCAHPKNFQNEGAFLKYCGYTHNQKYNRLIHASIAQSIKAMIMAGTKAEKKGNGKHYKYLHKFKETKKEMINRCKELNDQYPSFKEVNGKRMYGKGHAYNMAMNRTATEMMKEIYHIYH